MNIGSFSKQPVEVMDYDIDYSAWLSHGDNVDSATALVEPAGLTVDSIFINDPRVTIWLSGGVHGETYKLSIAMSTAVGRVKQDEFKVKVKDI